ncbi:MAG TPA: hypothetical protein VGD50_03450, partial [Candidatus Baltobacteraceae bacterium]
MGSGIEAFKRIVPSPPDAGNRPRLWKVTPGMPIIQTRDLRKVFRSVKRAPGALGALRTLFS